MKSIPMIISTIVLLLCHNLIITKALRILHMNSNYEKNFIEGLPFKEEQIFIKRCNDESENINLSSYDLTIIKDNSIKSTSIRSLSLRDNKLQDIPENMIKNLPYLNCLDLSKNEINIYKTFSMEHAFLSILNLSSQKLPNVFDVETFDENSIPTIQTNYKTIEFDNSNMRLKNLRYIDLSGNDISTLNKDFNMNFPNLSHLYLNNVNADIVDSSMYSKLPKSLRCLSLKDNKLSEFNFNNSITLSTLYLDSNPLQNITIISYTLKTLSLTNCTKANNIYLDAPNLDHLDISKNNIDVLTDFVVTRSLKTFMLNFNEFTTVPQLIDFNQLIELSLNYNKIKIIPKNVFANLLSLEKLELKGNKISYIDANTFSRLQNLKYLDLSYNKLEILYNKWTYSLMNLKYLNINANKISNIVDLSIHDSKLEHVFMINNPLREITSNDINVLLPDNSTVYIT
ncbi:PH domain leucine-rich repeat-containing protein phosphatase 2-like [Pseudomyrmex gracilis]|uniref:PH domain leucine-rich repeat-containing protein phosphatase 2-like n=1 Tax=Pseudomyrmex gracilis TaxID=219809 RepID=UPI000994D833|nr:PH domain leucine-rich repeat-containing protein phosphatase 2-like [Pseudomyrmex gracilis]